MKLFLWKLKRVGLNIEFWQLLFAPLGAAWTIYQILLQTRYADDIRNAVDFWPLLLGFGLLIGSLRYWPKSTITKRLPNVDTEVSIKVGNIFSSRSPIVVAIPTTLQTTFDEDIISRRSVQGQFTLKYCKTESALSESLKAASKLIQENGTRVCPFSDRVLKSYTPGEVFVVRDFDRTAYCVSFATFNEHGTAQITPDDFLDLLPKMWLGIRDRGDVGDLDVPLLSGRFARGGFDSRKEILREIIASFVAASAETRFVDKATFYISPSDYSKWGFSFDYFDRLLENARDDLQRKQIGQPLSGRGTPV